MKETLSERPNSQESAEYFELLRIPTVGADPMHLKDCVLNGDDLKSIAAGTGVMDYKEILKFMKARKPYIHTTLENTTDENAVSSRVFLQELYDSI